MIPAGCLTISDDCFAGCTALARVRLPDSLTQIGNGAFWKCAVKEVSLPDGCKVAKCAFWQCAALTKVTIGSGCTIIGEWVFSSCAALTTVTIGPGCASIGRLAFDRC
jgi:hypothetical protein